MPAEIRPVLNPVLSFKRDPRLVSVTGRSARENQIVVDRLAKQRIKLSDQILGLQSQATRQHAGKLLVAVKMFEDSFAPTYEPEAICRVPLGAELIAPMDGGYLAQVDRQALGNLSGIIRDGSATTFASLSPEFKTLGCQQRRMSYAADHCRQSGTVRFMMIVVVFLICGWLLIGRTLHGTLSSLRSVNLSRLKTFIT